MHDLPFKTYIEAWSFFRSISNETVSIASHLVNHTNIRNHHSFVDLGSGDGELTKNVLSFGVIIPKKLVLIDKEEKFLNAAKDSFQSVPTLKKTTFLKEDFTQIGSKVFRKFDAILAIHMLYFVELEFLIKLLNKLSMESTCYIVIDKLDSLFGVCWKEMNPSYFERLSQILEYINRLSNDEYNVEKSEIDSVLTNPLLLPPNKMRTILSLLFYSDDESVIAKGAEVLNIFTEGDMCQPNIPLSCYCFEISKKQK